jgi:glyoxylase-like metal-dependent hydrolase (beta-lactamase superfamily II)
VPGEELASGIVRVGSTLGSRWLQQWVIRGRDGALLLDTGIAGETVPSHIEPALRGLGIDPRSLHDVVISHADVDHYGGDADIRRLAPEARLRAHPLDLPLVESFARIAAERYGWYREHGLDYDPAVWDWLREAAGPDLSPDGTVDAGDVLDLGGTVVETVHLPGHSQGHIGLHHPATGSALIGDAVMGRGFDDTGGRPQLYPPVYQDVDSYLATIARLRDLAPSRLLTAHFPVIEGPQVAAFLDLSAAFVDELDAAVCAEVGDRPRTLRGLLPDCARRVGGFAEMELELARSIGAHLDRLEAMDVIERVATDGEPPSWRRA